MEKMFSPFAMAISAVVFITTACSKESVNRPDLQPEGVAAIAGIPVTKAQVTYDSRTGTYVSSYGGGISFGSSQPHPTTPYKSNVPKGWIIVGTITMADGTVISINDVVMA